jgi:hypothetical protein
MLRGGLTSMVTGMGIWWGMAASVGGFVYQIGSHRHQQARLG